MNKFKFARNLWLGLFLILWLYVLGTWFYWKVLYWPIRETGFLLGVDAGLNMRRCGVGPSAALNKWLSHFVAGDIIFHDCALLRIESLKEIEKEKK